MLKNKFVLITVLIALMLPVQALGDDLIDDKLLVPESANYNTFAIESGAYTKEVTASGYQVFIVEQNLSFEEGSARLDKVHVIRNAEVKAGDVLVTFEKEGSLAELENMKLQLTRLQESFDTDKRERSQAISALQSQLAGLEDAYDIKLKQLEIQQAQLGLEQYIYETERDMRMRRNDIDELSEYFADTQIVAPFDGLVTYITGKSKGDTVYAGETLITIQAQDRYVIGLDNDSGNFRYGMSVSVGLGPRNKKVYHDGRVIAAANILPNESKFSYALIEFYGEPEKNGLKNISISGLNVDLKNVLLIARNAITFEGGKSYVSILDGDMVQKRIIVSGHNTAGNTWVVQGLDEGQEVIID